MGEEKPERERPKYPTGFFDVDDDDGDEHRDPMPFSYESLLHSNGNNAVAVTETFLDEQDKCEQLQPRRNILTSEEMKNAINNLAKMTEEMGMARNQFDGPKLKGKDKYKE